MHQYVANTEADTSLTAATAKTVVQITTPSSRRCKVKEVSVSFNSTTTSDAPVLVQLVTKTTAGTGTARTPIAEDQVDPAALVSATVNHSAEGTTGVVLREWRITPVGGALIWQQPLGDEITLAVSTRLALVLTSAASQTGVRAGIKWQE